MKAGDHVPSIDTSLILDDRADASPILSERADVSLFRSDRVRVALEKYAAVTHLAVRIYDRDQQVVAALTNSNPLFELFTRGRQPRILDECVIRCFTQTDALVIVDNGHGLAVIGIPFTSGGHVVCAAVAAYALTAHLDQFEIRRLARESKLAFDSMWDVTRKSLPIPRYRLPVYGELLRIIGETLLSEHDRARQLEEMVSRLEAADQAKDEFLAVLSHELRAPLNAILGWSRMLRAGGLDPAMAAHALETIERNSTAQTRLINDLLDVSRIVAGKLNLEVQDVDLVPIVESVLDTVRVTAETKGIRIQAELDPSIGSVTGDAERLGQIVSNLLSNAVKFTASGGKVTVNLARDDSLAKITISDTGQGISPDFLPHIFERFRQADSTRTRAHGGLGLGLAIVQRLVELHGGTVRADSPGQGHGATFTVTLPLLDLPLTPTKKSLPLSDAKLPSLDGVRVWIVDDEENARKMLRTILERKGAQVTTLASAPELLKLLDEDAPEVLVCDVSMPGMDGYTLMRQIRARGAERGGNIPAIAQTGYATLEDRERALSSGYQIFLGKPIDMNELIRGIARLAGSKG
jgi:signal transduction histidine kinase/ActR/RegA family two-component response regulator